MAIDPTNGNGPSTSSLPPPLGGRQTAPHESLPPVTQLTQSPDYTSEIDMEDLEADEASDSWAVSGQAVTSNATMDPFADFEGDIQGDDTQIEMDDELPEQHTHLIRESVEPAVLVAVEGKDKGRRFTLTKGENSIGRSLDNDVILADPAVSRKHTKIIVEEEEVILADLGSGNGTMVNGMKVHRVQLAHGDRVEVGGTVMTLDLPENHPARKRRSLPKIVKDQPLAGVSSNAGLEPHHEQTLFSNHSVSPTPTDQIANTNVTSTELMWQQHFKPTVAMLRTGGFGQNVLIPKTWLIAIVLVFVTLALLLGATVTVLVLRGSSKRSETYDAAMLNQFMKQGREAYQHKQWDLSEQLFSRVLAHRSGDQTTMQFLRLIGDAREHENLLHSARQALMLGDIRTALSQAASIPANSPLASEAESIRLAVRMKEISEHLAASESARRRGDLREAERRMNMALMLDPDRELIQEDVTQPIVHTSRHTANVASIGSSASSAGGKPNMLSAPVSSVKNRILALYQAGDFTKASGFARTYVASHTGEPDVVELSRLSAQIDRFSVYYGKVRNEKNTASVIKQLQSAYLLDMQISGGFYARELRTPLLNEYTDQAKKSWQKSQYNFACQSVLQAWRLDPVNTEVQQLMQNCEQKAEQLLKEARRIEKLDALRANALYKDVVSMVPPGTGLYRQASERLDSKSGRDEDESN